MIPGAELGEPAKHKVFGSPSESTDQVHRQGPFGNDSPAASTGEFVDPGPSEKRALVRPRSERSKRGALERRRVLHDEQGLASDRGDEVDEPPG